MASAAEDLQLIVNGTKYTGWKTQRVTTSMDQLARTFEVSYTEKATQDSKPVPITRGDLCSVKIDGLLVLDGYAMDVSRSQAPGSYSANISGSSATGDLVVCAAVHKGGQWLNATVTKIATDICAPFGIKVRNAVSDGAKFSRFALEDGEGAYDAINRAARMRGLLVITEADGTLLLTRAGTYRSGTTLEYGVNVKTSDYRSSSQDLFSSYTVKAQVAGSDLFGGSSANKIKGTVEEVRVTRYRPIIISADTEDTRKELTDRAAWERNQRYGAATRYTCSVYGWYDKDKVLWAPNTLARVKDPSMGVDDVLLIVSVQFQRTIEEGTITTLELTRQEAYDIIAIPPKRAKATNGMF